MFTYVHVYVKPIYVSKVSPFSPENPIDSGLIVGNMDNPLKNKWRQGGRVGRLRGNTSVGTHV